MDAERFARCCQAAASGARPKGGIGTLGEKTLHTVVKAYFQPDPEKREVRVGPYIADARTGDGLLEVQTRSFYKLRPKLEYFLSQGPVTVAYPVPAVKWLSWIAPGGEVTPRRKSPAKPPAGSVLFELSALGELARHPNFRLCALLLELEEYRLLNGWGNGGKRGSTRFDRVPLALLDAVWVRCPGEYAGLLAPGLPPAFTAKELGKGLCLSPKKAAGAARFLRETGAIRQIGKRGGAFLYERVPAPEKG